MTSQPETRMVAVDGTDALAYVILRPGSNASGIVIEAAASGISKPYAAYALRHTAQSWDPDDTVGADVGEQLKEALAEIEQLKADRNRFRAAWNNARSRAQSHAADLVYTEELGGQAIRAEAQAVHDLEADNARLRAELEQTRDKVRAVEQARCWTNEDGKRFVFADDLLAAVQLATPADPCAAETVHQAGCDTSQHA